MGEEETYVRVAARVRPLLPRERALNCCSCVSVHQDTQQVVVGTRRTFAFDVVFDTQAAQSEVYEACVAPLVEGCLQGYNATILAYGQTGSGKTHTMGTGASGSTPDGITPQVIRNSFAMMEGENEKMEFRASCCYLEIYNEEIRDLLRASGPDGPKQIRETADGVIQVVGLHAEACSSAEDMLRCLADGSVQRTTGATLMNEQSSRSHSIFTIILERSRRREDGERPGSDDELPLTYRTAKFHLVDLAGSERAKRTGAVGNRLKESVAINSGLLALGNVISALGDPAKRGSHVPYRASKLTRLLQDSLGGNSRTLMVACTSSSDLDFEETLNTLKYAHRARNIKNKPVVNHDPKQAQLAAMQDEIEALRSALQRASETSPVPVVPVVPEDFPVGEAQVAINEMMGKLERGEKRIIELAERLVGVEGEREALRVSLTETYCALCRYLQSIQHGNGEVSSGNLRGGSAEISKVLQAARRLLTEKLVAQGGDAEVLPPVPPAWPCIEVLEDFPSTPGALTREGSEETANDFGETGKLRTLSQMRRDSTSLIRSYLEEIRRLENETAQQKRRMEQLQEELVEARGDLQKDEEIFEDKMRGVRSLEEENASLKAELQEVSLAFPSRNIGGFSRSASADVSVASVSMDVQDGKERRTFPTDGEVTVEDQVDEAVRVELEESREAQHQMEQELQTLDLDTQLKKDLMSELTRSEKEWGTAKAQYQRRMERCQGDMEQAQRELSVIEARSLDTSQSRETASSEEKKLLEQRMSEQRDSVRKLQHEFNRMRELRHQDSRRIRDLEAELRTLDTSQSELDRRLQAEKKRTARLEEIKQQQVMEIQKRMSNRSAVFGHERRVPTQSRKTTMVQAASSPVPGDYGSEVADDSGASSSVQHFERHIDDHIRRHEVSQSLKDDQQKRDALLRKREQYLSYRVKVGEKESKEQHEAREQLHQLEGRLALLDQQIAEVSADNAASLEDLERDRAQRDALRMEQTEMQRSLQGQRNEGLGVLHEIDERLEGLQDEIDFREARIARARQFMLPGATATSSLESEIARVPPEEAKVLLCRYCEKLVRLRQRDKQNGKRLTALDHQLEERSRQVTELQLVLRKQDANAKKTIAKVVRECEGRIRLLLKQSGRTQPRRRDGSEASDGNPVSEASSSRLPETPGKVIDPVDGSGSGSLAVGDLTEVQQLRRDMQYYKVTNRELKRRLRTALERNDGVGGESDFTALVAQIEKLEREKESLSEENARVMAQVQSLKQYAARFQNVTPASPAGHAEPSSGVALAS